MINDQLRIAYENEGIYVKLHLVNERDNGNLAKSLYVYMCVGWKKT